MITAHRLRGTWNNDVDAYVAATNISREKLIEGGLPAEKIYVKPNFLDHPPERKSMLGNHCLFVGRLTEEKGVRTLLDAWQTYDLDISLKIAGTGPLEELVQQAASVNANIQPLGMQTRLEVLAEMEQAYVLIFPSVWYEGLPMTLVEALASGLPCIASNLGAMVEVVTDGETGLLFAPGSAEQLAAKVRWAFQQPELVCQMGQNARSEFDTKYSPERNYELLMGVYERAIEVRRRSGHS
jgi:glycosyltransferase involved in cell wall biosynthesis